MIKIALANLMTFPWIAEPAAAGDLKLHGAWFAIRTGALMILRQDGLFAEPEVSATSPAPSF